MNHPSFPTKIALVFATLLMGASAGRTRTLRVGSGQSYTTVRAATEAVQPGDTILLQAGTHAPDQFIGNLKGTAAAWIVIRGAGDHGAIVSGGSQAWMLEDPAYVRIENIVFERQTTNGVHLHDGDSYASPAHHVIFESCWFRDMAGTGNNDQIKASGLDSFEVRNCRFTNGAHGGGSGIDMVGCHWGTITQCTFENMGNPLQAKGGSRFIRMERNFFKDVTMRGVNLGGSTDLEYFRPLNATFEAADIQVYSSLFINVTSPICFAGATRCEVINNTIYNPQRYVVRILQETVDPQRFVPSGNGRFRNNIIAVGNGVTSECNTGPDTDPGSFRFSNNLWYNFQNASWTAPRDLPVVDSNSIVDRDPGFANPGQGNFSLTTASPAFEKGMAVPQPVNDYEGRPFSASRAIGAFEVARSLVHYDVISGKAPGMTVWREANAIVVNHPAGMPGFRVEIADARGQVIASGNARDTVARVVIRRIQPGTYIVSVSDAKGKTSIRIVVQ